MREDTEDYQEDDESGDPAPEFVSVHDFVAEESDDKCAHGDDDNADRTIDIGVYGIDELGTNDAVDTRPANAGEDIEERNQLDTPPTEPEARKHHLA